MTDIFVYFYYENIFREVDITKYDKTVLSLGKSAKCDIVINHESLSDKEIILKKDKNEWYLIDKAGHGIYKNNQRFSKTLISSNSIFLIGQEIKTDKEYHSKVAIIVKDGSNHNTQIKKVHFSNQTEIMIGKADSNNIRYYDSLVSSHHAKIFLKKNDYYIIDLDSINGIYINGILIKKMSILKSGDTIIIGGHKIIYNNESLSIYNNGSDVEINGFNTREDIRIVRNVSQSVFRRSPRLRAEIPSGKISILNPPQQPTKPQVSWLSIFLPPILMGISMSIISKLAGYNPIYMAATLLVSFGTVPIALISYFSQKKKYKSDILNRQFKYANYIQNVISDLNEKSSLQKKISYDIHPDFNTCVERIINKDRRLWERAFAYDDFLTIRLGIGNEDLKIKIVIPQDEIRLDEDNLYDKPKEIYNEFSIVNSVPICIQLYKLSTVGFIGNRDDILNFSKDLIIKIATHHSYDEVKIVVIFPPEESDDWKWLRWLPHIWDESKQIRYLADDKENSQIILSNLYDILKQREFKNHENAKTNKVHSPHYIFILADMSLLENQPILSYLIYNKENFNVTSLFFFDRLELLPKDCQIIVDLDGKNSCMYSKDNTSLEKKFVPDKTDSTLVERVARKMASIRIKKMLSSTDLPNNVSLLDLYEVKSVESLHIEERWKDNLTYRTMAAPIGVRLGGEKLYLDLHEKSHGPHGLCAGTTGSGKSEILITYIISMAINFHPHEVAFVLIDYKGGGMANTFEKLPHLLGTITNLGGNQTKRAMICIYSEIKKRQILFDKYSVNHIDDYQKLSTKDQTIEPMPHLIIVADEFAELKADNPEFIDDLVSAARVGRSLGVHLILATQKPSGVVNDQIWSNSRFKLCLKVQDTEDSREMLKRTEAASIVDPGRAYLQVGNNEIFELFQSAYSGSEYNPDEVEENNSIDIYSVDLIGKRKKLNSEEKLKKNSAQVKKQIEVVLTEIINTFNKLNIKKLNNIWPDILPEQITLGQLLIRTEIWNGKLWLEQKNYFKVIIGLLDYPAKQLQEKLYIDFKESGHLGIIGGPGGGKTTFLNTLILATILTYSPKDINIYILDFGARSLSMYADLPHVGGVIMADEGTKINKFSKFILKEMDIRKRTFAKLGLGNIVSYNSSKSNKLPAILIIIDNTVALYDTYDNMFDDLARLSREGANLGIHLALTANDINGLGYKTVGNIKMICAIQLTDKLDYSNTVGSSYGLYPSEVKGRGLIKGNPALEFQTALPFRGENDVAISENIKNLIQNIKTSWSGSKAKPIPIMPKKILYDDLIKNTATKNNFAIPIGLDYENIEPVYLDLLELNHLIVSGSSMSGKTNLLKTWLMGLMENFAPDKIQIYIIDSNAVGLYALKESKHVANYGFDLDSIKPIMNTFKKAYEIRKEKQAHLRRNSNLDKKVFDNHMILVIDDLADFSQLADDEIKEFWCNIIKRDRNLGIHLAAAGLSNDITTSYSDPLLQTIKDFKSGLLFGAPAEHNMFGINLPYSEMSKQLKVGECYLANQNKVLKLLTAHIEELDIAKQITKINKLLR